MKLECPYCWQHYEIEKSDMDRELVCINCEQTFRVQDAMIIDNSPLRKYRMLMVIGGLVLVILLLGGFNLYCWHRLSSRPAEPAIPAAAPAASSSSASADMQTSIAPLYQSIKNLQRSQEKLQQENAALVKRCSEFTVRLDKAEKQNSASAGVERVAAMEEGLNTLSIKIEAVNAQLKLQEENHRQFMSELMELRKKASELDVSDRLLRLERKAGSFDLAPVNRKIEKLSAIVDAMRLVH